ncbi:MAG: MFS transporter, partial [Candidatus Odinarchaeota archaeon]
MYGAYLYTLGASSFFVGLISGIGEFLGYILRFLSGYLSDKTKNYWILTILGYASLVAVPLMGYVSIWQMAMMFIFWERIGKGLRSPPKDTMMSYATAQVGHGKGFGIHEALDQVGAIIGPLLFAFAFTIRNDYQTGFKLMWIPYFFLLAVIAITYKKYTDPKLAFIKNEPEKEKVKKSNLQIKSPLSREFIYYSLFILFSVVGFVGYPLIAFYTNANKILTLQYIPILYAISMGVDGVFALVIGNFFDKKGFKVLFLIPMLTVIMVLLVFSNSVLLVIIGVIFWGIIMA